MSKGNSQWKPHNRGEVFEKKQGYGYRFLRNDDMNLRAKEAEGWVIPNKTNGLAGDFLEPKDKSSGGRKQGDLILAVMDDETIKSRAEYFDQLSDAQVRGIKDDLQRSLAASSPKAQAHGSIVIE